VKDLGPKSSEWLASVGVHSLDDVTRLGVVETYKRVKAAYPEKVTLNMLWGLQAASLGIRWDELSPDIKEELKRQVEDS
jgi:DNA transformation protein